MTFTTLNWASARAVTVTGTSDTDALDHTGVISHSVASNDSTYHGRTAASVNVTVIDDEDIPVTVRFERRSYDVTEGGSVTVKVLLSADPERTVTIPVTTTNPGTTTDDDYSGVPNGVTFNAGDTEVSFTVAGTQDTVDDDGESVLLGFGSTLPNAVTAGSRAETTLNIGDDDDPEVTVSFEYATYAANEGSGVTVTVVLSPAPEREVIIPLTTTNQGGAADGDYSGVPANVTFNATETEKTFTFRATQDMVDDGGKSVQLGFGALPARVTAGGTATAIVDIADDDTRGVRVEPTQLTFREGGTGTYTVALNTQPTATVTVTVNDPTDNTDVAAEPTSLTFTTGDWKSAQRVTVSAVRDSDANTDTATVTHSVSGGDYNAVSAADVIVTVTEGPPPPPPPPPPITGGGGGGGGAPANRAPEFAEGDRTTRSVAENTSAGADIGDPVTATDFNRDALTYSLRGLGSDLFDVDASSGQLLTKAALDYETESSYTVFVWVQDNKNAIGRPDTQRDTVIRVAITVTNEDEPGTVTLSLSEPGVDIPLTASLTDPDGGLDRVVWSWERSADQTAWAAIRGAASAAYTPVAADKGSYLRATASYTDGHGPRKSAQAATATPVPSNAAPEFTDAQGGAIQRSVPENTGAGEAVGAPVAATDAEDSALTYALSGPDSALFTIDGDTGQIRVGAGTALDYEADKNIYRVDVIATDSLGASATVAVTIKVTDVDLGPYDVNKNEAIERDEAIAAVVDYYSDLITKEETIEVVQLYSPAESMRESGEE